LTRKTQTSTPDLSPLTLSSCAKTLRRAYHEFSILNPARHGAALAFYGAFALVPILAIGYQLTRTLLSEVGLLHLADLQAQFAELLGPEAALAIQQQVAEATARTQDGSALVTVVGVLALLYTASGAFAQLKYSLNTIWGVPHDTQLRTGAMVVTRLLGMALVFGVGLLLVVAVVASVVLVGLSGWLGLGSDVPILNTLLSFVLVTLLFGLLYKILLDARVSWLSAGRARRWPPSPSPPAWRWSISTSAMCGWIPLSASPVDSPSSSSA